MEVGIWIAALAWLGATCPPARAQLVVENFESQTVVRQSAALIRGRSPAGEEVVVARSGGEVVFRAPVVAGRFTALVELRAGKNDFRLSSGKLRAELALDFLPATSRRRVRVVYVVPSDGRGECPTQRANDRPNTDGTSLERERNDPRADCR